MKTRHEMLVQVADEMCSRELKTGPDSAEYQLLDYLCSDDELALLSEMKIVTPYTAGALAKKTGMTVDKARKLLDGMAEKAYFLDVKLPKVNTKLYMLVPFAPGMFEFQMCRPGYVEDNPEIARLFQRHAFESYADVAPANPMGVGIMRVIPVESALPADTKRLTMERLSTLIETTVGGHFCLVPCQCRKVRRIMGEATGDLEDGMCLYTGLLAESMLRHGRGKKITKEEAYEHLKRTEEMGCIHQITTLESGITFAVCNCQPSSCMAIGGSAYYGTPNMSRSNFVSEIDKEKCVACGQCVEVCANNALRLGQKVCSKTPIVHTQVELPDEIEWGPERFDPDHRDDRKNVVETGSSPCKATCPAHIAVQGYIKLAAQGKYMEALELIKKENPFPAVCGRICPHNCENECTRGEIDQPVAIDEIKRFIADRELDASQRFIPKKLWHHDKKIAVIGSGPAGLSCAYFLAAGGYKVTVFEKELKPGGMLTNGIPGFRLEKDVVDAEIDVLRALNVRFKCGVEVGKDVTIPELRVQGYEAFYLGIGLQDGGRLGIPGDDAAGVLSGVDFLKIINRGNNVKLHGKVVVIGGGSIGADVARTAIRYGADSVDLYCLEAYDEMPMGEEDQAYCKEDGVTIHAGWGQTEIIKKGNRCAGVKFRKCVSVKNEEGRFDPKFDDSVTEEAECSAILYCIGQKPAWDGLLQGVNVERTARGLVIADPLTYQTSEPDIFAGGDIYTGQKFCIDAIAAGKQGAISINRYVWEGHSLTIGRDRREFKALDKANLDFDNISYDNIARQVPGVNAAKVRTKANESLTFTEEQVKKETSRCLGCGATIVDQNRCLGCGICTTRCKFDAIHLIRKFDVPIHSIRNREKFVENYRKERNAKIAVNKIRSNHQLTKRPFKD
ncbi:MAG: FAD-dependent oxidoreductase [Mogibacterium sp.]|nr:FAD-dependent oxidoreductase [Mogibacterium sp.]